MSGLKRTVLLTCAIGALTAGISSTAKADTDPRDYEGVGALPDKSSIFLAYYRHITTSDSSNLTQNLALFRYTWIKKFGHLTLDFIDFILPVADAAVYVPNGQGTNTVVAGSGLGDLLYVATVVYDIPENEKTATFVGASEYVTLPTGNYDRDKAINIGAHRWVFKEELYLGQRFLKNFSAEILGNVTSYTTNTSFTVPVPAAAGGPQKGDFDQKPTFGFEAHFMADVANYLSMGLSYYALANGRQDVSLDSLNIKEETAVKQQTVQSIRGTVALRLEKQSLVLFQYQNDIAASGDASIGRFFGVRVSHFWF